MLMLSLVTIGVTYSKYNTHTVEEERNNKTAIALKKAKEALIYYSLSNDYLYSASCLSSTSCPRPGELPCPDRTDDGISDASCNTAARRLSRLPWKTLGLNELTDGYGERLWYAVSNNYKNSPRLLPLNSNTMGTITVKDATGRILYDASTGGGVVAVIFSAGNAIVRQDGYNQNRDIAGSIVTNNYLDIANNEDNADYVDSNTNGFIVGPVKDVNGNIISNDRLIVITRDEMAAAMDTYVLSQVREELQTYYNSNFYFPYPAAFTDTTCTPATNVDISTGCDSIASNYEGRIPVSNVNQAGSNWPNPPSLATSLLKGLRASNWFQQNHWRELIYYVIAPDCEILTLNCSGASQKLTLNNALSLPNNNKNAILISASIPLVGQNRINTGSILDYFEDENATTLDFIYSRPTSSASHDRVISIP